MIPISANYFQTTWVLAQFLKADYKYISITSIDDQAADGGFLDYCLP